MCATQVKRRWMRKDLLHFFLRFFYSATICALGLSGMSSINSRRIARFPHQLKITEGLTTCHSHLDLCTPIHVAAADPTAAGQHTDQNFCTSTRVLSRPHPHPRGTPYWPFLHSYERCGTVQSPLRDNTPPRYRYKIIHMHFKGTPQTRWPAIHNNMCLGAVGPIFRFYRHDAPYFVEKKLNGKEKKEGVEEKEQVASGNGKGIGISWSCLQMIEHTCVLAALLSIYSSLWYQSVSIAGCVLGDGTRLF